MFRKTLISGLFAGVFSTPLFAGEVEIVNVTASTNGSSWQFDVTLRHADTGWDHYADGWEVLTPDGKSLGYRMLAHPHVQEQPFTRSLSGVEIPEGITSVLVRARDTDGWTDAAFPVLLPD